MRPILYAHNETAFDTNGIGVLADAIECRVRESLNGTYELTLKYPLTGIHYKEIVKRAIIMAKPNPVSDPQPFRIYRRVPSSKGTIVAYARHIAYDLMGIIVSPFTATGILSALPAIPANAVTDCPFTFWTDKTTGSTLTVSAPKDIWTLLGGSEGSLLDVFGGEYEFDRYDVKLWNRRGADRGVSIRYGKNLTSLEQDENCASCYTGVYPYWTDSEGSLVQLPEKVVYASGTYDHVRIYPLDLSSEWTEAPTEDQLRAAAENYIVSHDIGTPDVSWKVEHVALEQTEEYKGTALLERVLLGDTITTVFPDMGVSASARVVETDFDVLLERYNSITQGTLRANIADTIAHQEKEIAKKPTQTLVQAMVTTLTAGIIGAKGGAVRLLDTDGDGLPDELYIADKPDPAQALKVWRFNYEGWAAASTGYSGPFVMGATLENGILANAVTAANLVAGLIQSKDGETFFLDLDNSILRMKAVDELGERITNVGVNADGLGAEISNQAQEMESLRTSLASISATAGEISLSVQKILEEGVNRIVTGLGLTITDTSVDIHRLGGEMTNSLNETGMYVIRGKGSAEETTMLQANADGVIATDVTIRNYLNMGNYSRFEDYNDGTDSKRTACYWIGGD